jgi:hypothetical protein
MLSTATAGFIFRCLSLLSFAWLLYLVYRVWAVRSWPAVVGTVLESRVDTDADSNSFPVVRYKYSVRGTEHIGSQIFPHGQFATSGGHAARIVSKYKAGSRVRVYVNPASATDSALRLALPGVVYLMLFVATLMFWWMGGLLRSGLAD